DLRLDLEEAIEEGPLLDRQAIPVRLLLEGIADPLLPVDQGSVTVGGHPLDVFQLRKGHQSRGIIAICISRASLPCFDGPREGSYRLSQPWICSSTRERNCSRATGSQYPRDAWPTRWRRRSPPPRRSATGASSRRRCRSAAAARPAA